MIKFRDLTAEEIDCRVSTVSDKGCSLLLYKDARADMIILDETVGPENWQRSHELINGNLFCNVSIKCDGEWITKQDVGTESFTEKEKGQASDSFKRACFNWGLGRELYSAPFIWIGSDKVTITKNAQGKPTTYDRFEVVELTIVNKRITGLAIANEKTGEVVYTFGHTKAKKSSKSAPISEPIKNEILSPICPKCGKPVKPVKRQDGTTGTPEEVLKGCGMCYDCYKSEKK